MPVQSLARPWPRATPATAATVAAMALALALFYQAGTAVPALLGLAIFGLLALLRPDLALPFVPLTAPLYLIPASIAGIRARGFDLPLHEATLLATAAAVAARWALARLGYLRRAAAVAQPSTPAFYAPHALFLLAGGLGVALAVARGPALIEFRRLVAEPLLFYWLARCQLAAAPRAAATKLVAALAVGGALVGLLALLQYAGADLVPLLGHKQCFAPDGGPCANVIADNGVRRVQSVYGHPNNLGLFLGRVWPLAAALAFAGWRARRAGAWLWALAVLLAIGGLGVSFSRGAWLGALAALAVLALGLLAGRASRWRAGRPLAWLLGAAAALLVLGGLALSLRGDVRGGSTPVRLLLWQEALGYLRLHPLGIGLDQFATYHDPASSLSLIDPALIGTSEQYAAHPHNLLLDTWLRLGPLGLAAFGWLLARFARAAWRQRRQPLALGAGAAMVAALAHGLVDNFYFVSDLAIVFWLLIALVETTDDRYGDRDQGLGVREPAIFKAVAQK